MENKKTTEVAVSPSKEVQTHEISWTAEQVELIKTTVARGATNDELKLFLYTAKRTGLDPLTKQIHFVKRWDSTLQKEVGAIQTGIDGYRAIAERSGALAGIDDVKYEMDAETGKPAKATVTIYKMVEGQRVPFTASAWWTEYAAKKKAGGYTIMWERMPRLMLGKCAEALALRKAFPNDLSGLYTTEEMQQADNEVVNATATPISPKAIREAETVPFPTTDELKAGITAKLHLLHGKDQIKADTVYTFVKADTGLDLIEANYEEIDNRLAVKVEEKLKANQTK